MLRIHKTLNPHLHKFSISISSRSLVFVLFFFFSFVVLNKVEYKTDEDPTDHLRSSMKSHRFLLFHFFVASIFLNKFRTGLMSLVAKLITHRFKMNCILYNQLVRKNICSSHSTRRWNRIYRKSSERWSCEMKCNALLFLIFLIKINLCAIIKMNSEN